MTVKNSNGWDELQSSYVHMLKSTMCNIHLNDMQMKWYYNMQAALKTGDIFAVQPLLLKKLPKPTFALLQNHLKKYDTWK